MDGVLGVAEVLDVEAFDVEWLGEGGEVRLPLSKVAEVAFEDVAPVREFPSYRGQRHFPCRYWAASTTRDDKRKQYDTAREHYHARLVIVSTPTTRHVAATGRKRIVLNRYQHSARRGLIVTGPAGAGKTTAITQLGKNYLQLVHCDQPHPGGSLPVAYVTVPPAATPKMLAVEFARFLGLPLPARFGQVKLTNKVCDLLGTLRTTLILIDELHNLDLGTRVGAEESDQIKYLSERVPATFVLAGVDLEGNGLFAGRRGGQIASTARPARASPGSSSNARPATSFSACATSDGCTARNNTPCTLHQRWTQRLNQLRHDPPPPLPTQPLPRRTGNVPGNGPPHRAGRITSLANHPPAARRSRAPSRAAVIRAFRPARAKPS